MVLDGLTLVVSPLIALMKDQVDQLQSLGLPVSFVNSTLLDGRAIRPAGPDGGRAVPAGVRGAGAVSQRAVPGGGPGGGAEAAGGGRGPLHQRVGARLPPRLRPAGLLPQAAGQPDDHRPDGHGHRPRPPRHRRAVGAARSEDFHHRLRPAQPVLRGAMPAAEKPEGRPAGAIFSTRRRARASSTPRRGNGPKRWPRSSPSRRGGRRRSITPACCPTSAARPRRPS